jgi:hypothetical protein
MVARGWLLIPKLGSTHITRRSATQHYISHAISASMELIPMQNVSNIIDLQINTFLVITAYCFAINIYDYA